MQSENGSHNFFFFTKRMFLFWCCDVVLSGASVNEPLFFYRDLKLCRRKEEVFTLVVDYFLESRQKFSLKDQIKRKKSNWSE